MKNTSRLAFAFLFTAMFSLAAHSQIRQTHLYIDDGFGNFTILSSAGAGTLTLPAGTGTLLTTTNEATNVVEYGTAGQNALTDATKYLFNISYGTLSTDADALGAVITSDATQGTHTNVNATALTLSAKADGAAKTATALSLSATNATGAAYDIQGDNWDVDNQGNIDGKGLIAGNGFTGGNLTIHRNDGSDHFAVISALTTTTGEIDLTLPPVSGALALEPMTTLGDMTYEGTPPTAMRLAGNTSTTKKFLTQTGTGTVSAAPAWGTISNSDVSGLGTMSTQNATAVAITGGTGTFTNSASIAATLSGTNAFTGSSINGAIAGQFTSSGTNTAASNIAILASAFGNGGSTNYALYAALGDVDINQGNFTQVSGTMFLGDGAGNTVDMLFYAGNGVPGDRELILPATTGTGSTNLFLPDEGTSNNTFMVTSGTHSATFNGLSADRVYTLPDASVSLLASTTQAATDNTVPLTIEAHSVTQAVDLQDWESSAPAVLASIDKSGNFSTSGTISTTANLPNASAATIDNTGDDATVGHVAVGLTINDAGSGSAEANHNGLVFNMTNNSTTPHDIVGTGERWYVESNTGNITTSGTVMSSSATAFIAGNSTGNVGEIQLNNGAGETVTLKGTNANFNPTFLFPGVSGAGPWTLALAGGTILNQITQQTGANFNIDGSGTIGGTLDVGSSAQLTVDASGNLSTSGTIKTTNALGNGGTPSAGTVYSDNTIRAWGNIPAAGTAANSEFGISSYTHTNGTGVYVLTLATALSSATSGIAMVSSLTDSAPVFAAITGSGTTVTVHTFSNFTGTTADEPFYLQVAGR